MTLRKLVMDEADSMDLKTIVSCITDVIAENLKLCTLLECVKDKDAFDQAIDDFDITTQEELDDETRRQGTSHS